LFAIQQSFLRVRTLFPCYTRLTNYDIVYLYPLPGDSPYFVMQSDVSLTNIIIDDQLLATVYGLSVCVNNKFSPNFDHFSKLVIHHYAHTYFESWTT